MTNPPPAVPTDSGWYLDVVHFAQHSAWLHDPARIYTALGFVLLALIGVAAWWGARRRGGAAMAAVIAVPVATLVAFLINDGVKQLVEEQRPCRTLHVTTTVAPCDPVNDYAFPSNHTVIAAALAVGVVMVRPRWGWLTVPLALLMGMSRVYVGAHYPHDVVAGLLIGTVVAVLLGLLARRWLAGFVDRMRETGLRALLGGGQDAIGASAAEQSSTRSAGDSSISSPRRPPLQNTTSKPVTDVSRTTGRRRR